MYSIDYFSWNDLMDTQRRSAPPLQHLKERINTVTQVYMDELNQEGDCIKFL